MRFAVCGLRFAVCGLHPHSPNDSSIQHLEVQEVYCDVSHPIQFLEAEIVMHSQHLTEIFVCALCRSPGAPREAPRAGRALLEEIENLALCENMPFKIHSVDCMSGCNRACTLALQAHGKVGYFFGDLVPDSESAAQVLACAQSHQDSANGFLARDDRPERLREGILARLPPPWALAN
jgi:predicted metal-binding protein